MMTVAYAASGQYKKAYETFSGDVKIKDSIYSFQNKMEIARLETKHETELKNKDLAIRDKQGKINKLTVDVKRSERIIYIISIALLLLLVSLALRWLYVFRRSNSRLRKEKSDHLSLIQKQSENIHSQGEMLDEIATLHAHSVRQPVASILGLTGLFNNKNLADPTNKEIIDGITTMAHELDYVIKDIVRKENEIRKNS